MLVDPKKKPGILVTFGILMWGLNSHIRPEIAKKRERKEREKERKASMLSRNNKLSKNVGEQNKYLDLLPGS